MMRVTARVSALLLALAPALAAWVAVATADPGFTTQAAVALIAFLAAAWLLMGWLDRGHPDPLSRRARLIWVVGGAFVYAVTAHLTVGRSPTRVLEDPVAPADVEYLRLSDGARLAMRRIGPAPHAGGAGDAEPVDAGRRAPVVWLHDGPGMPVLPMIGDDRPRPLRSAAGEGFEVVFYDQRGAGLSDRYDLKREGPYTVAGHLEDLEEVRTLLGAERMILAGHGWGASLAAEYLAAHPGRVERMILLSPAPLWLPAWEDFVAPSARARMSEVEASALALAERPPLRLVVGRLTASASRAAAHGLVPDWEADQWWTRSTREAWRLGQPKPTCADTPPGGLPPLEGLGYFAYSYTIDDALGRPDPREALRRSDVPVLLMRGLCDWVASEVANEYLEVLPGAQYVAVPGAGHLAWLEMAGLQEQVVADFLAGRPIPLAFFNPR